MLIRGVLIRLVRVGLVLVWVSGHGAVSARPYCRAPGPAPAGPGNCAPWSYPRPGPSTAGDRGRWRGRDGWPGTGGVKRVTTEAVGTAVWPPRSVVHLGSSPWHIVCRASQEKAGNVTAPLALSRETLTHAQPSPAEKPRSLRICKTCEAEFLQSSGRGRPRQFCRFCSSTSPPKGKGKSKSPLAKIWKGAVDPFLDSGQWTVFLKKLIDRRNLLSSSHLCEMIESGLRDVGAFLADLGVPPGFNSSDALAVVLSIKDVFIDLPSKADLVLDAKVGIRKLDSEATTVMALDDILRHEQYLFELGVDGRLHQDRELIRWYCDSATRSIVPYEIVPGLTSYDRMHTDVDHAMLTTVGPLRSVPVTVADVKWTVGPDGKVHEMWTRDNQLVNPLVLKRGSGLVAREFADDVAQLLASGYAIDPKDELLLTGELEPARLIAHGHPAKPGYPHGFVRVFVLDGAMSSIVKTVDFRLTL